MTKPTENQEIEDQSDIFSMSDEDFMKLSAPPAKKEAASVVETPVAEEPEVENEPTEPAKVEPEVEVPTGNVEENSDNNSEDNNVEKGTNTPEKSLSSSPTGSTEADKAKAEKGNKEPSTDEKPKPETEKPALDYKSFHDEVMRPFKANGKTVQLQSPEEAIALMKMGANYTRKMQDIAPHRKVLIMLENNGLLDEGKLSYLVDLDKKNPDAIKKLIKESGMDPMDLDPAEPVNYLGGNHKVTDQEAAFRNHLDDLQSNPEGKETIAVIANSWDQASKEMLWNNPEVMETVHAQRENGIYDRISAEVDRLKTLGQIPANAPFLSAYQQVGQFMDSQGKFADLVPKVAPKATTTAPAAPLATKAAKPKSDVVDDPKVAAAAATRSTTTKQVGKSINPLAMSDDEFMKQFKNRH